MRRQWIMAGAILAVLIFGFSLLSAQEPTPVPCIEDYYFAYPGPGIPCAPAAQTEQIAHGVKLTEIAIAVAYSATEGALPQPTHTIAVMREPAEPTSMTPGGVPDRLKTPVSFDPTEGDIPILRGSTSLWRLGALPSSSPYDTLIIYALARPKRDGLPARLYIVPDSNSVTEGERQAYYRKWPLPEGIERVEITGFDDLQVAPEAISGLMNFSTSDGITGQVNLATGEIILGVATNIPTTTVVSETVEPWVESDPVNPSTP